MLVGINKEEKPDTLGYRPGYTRPASTRTLQSLAGTAGRNSRLACCQGADDR
jgi:hypothetical protein